jgi:hypothetical protein
LLLCKKPDLGSIEFDGINVLKIRWNCEKFWVIHHKNLVFIQIYSEKNLLDYFLARLKGISSGKERDGNCQKKSVGSVHLSTKENKHVSGYSEE